MEYTAIYRGIITVIYRGIITFNLEEDIYSIGEGYLKYWRRIFKVI